MIDIDNTQREDLWYTVGLIATDGNLSLSGRHVSITSKDLELLSNVKFALGITNKITLKANAINPTEKIYGVLQICSKNFYNFLAEVGMTTSKSLTLGPLAIPDGYLHDFLRGVIDGDGCIRCWTHPTNFHEQWSTRIATGSKSFAYWLENRIRVELGVAGKVYGYKRADRKNFIYQIKYGKMATIALVCRCYYPGCLCLKRKQMLAVRCIRPNSNIRAYTSRSA